MNRLFIITLVVLLFLTSLFGYLSYTFYSDKATLKADVDRLAKANESLVSDVEKATKSCLIVDEINRKHNEEQKALNEKKEGVVKQIDTLEQKPKAIKKETVNETQSYEVDIDAPLPNELVELLNEAYRDAIQRQGAYNTR